MKMKTIKIKKAIILLLTVAFVSVSCNDFLDVNDNPNNPSFSTPSLTLPVALESFTALNARTMTYLGNFLVVNWATPSNWSANAIYSRYNFTSSDFGNIFETSYVSIFKNLTYIETYEDASGAVDYSYYKAISKIVKGFQYQLLVDLYGDVPYTEANLRGENTTPAYDDAQTVYESVIDELEVAVGLIQNAPENAENPGNQDIIYKGDMDSWVQFANSIKLRMLVRMSKVKDNAYLTQKISKINANGGGYLMAHAATNPGYSNDAGKQNPFYDFFIKPATGEQQDRNDYTVASEHAISFLEGTQDPRLELLYKPSKTGGEFKGAVQSTALPGSGFTSNDLSKVGSGLLVSSDQDQIVMSLSEILFIQAEATVHGFLPGGDAKAKTLYEEAITQSFLQLGGSAEDAEAYYGQDVNNVGWDASSDKIEAIMTQKWIALNGTSSIESWIDLTRTGFPANLPIPAESAGKRPVRLLYPASEVARNSDNVPQQPASDAFTNNPFWKN